jgi:hypothetical protein
MAILVVTAAALPQAIGIVVVFGIAAIAVWLYLSLRHTVSDGSSTQSLDHSSNLTSAPIDGSGHFDSSVAHHTYDGSGGNGGGGDGGHG